MTRIRLKPRQLSFVAILALAILTIGCNGDSPVAPDPSASQVPATDPSATLSFENITVEAGELIEKPKFVRVSGAQHEAFAQSTTGYVTPYGGLVSNGLVSLWVPAGAVKSNVVISMVMDDKGRLIVDMGPHGQRFEVPVYLSFDLSYTNADGKAADIKIAWFNDKSGEWETVTNLEPYGNVIRAKLDHFSKYSGVGG